MKPTTKKTHEAHGICYETKGGRARIDIETSEIDPYRTNPGMMTRLCDVSEQCRTHIEKCYLGSR